MTKRIFLTPKFLAILNDYYERLFIAYYAYQWYRFFVFLKDKPYVKPIFFTLLWIVRKMYEIGKKIHEFYNKIARHHQIIIEFLLKAC